MTHSYTIECIKALESDYNKVKLERDLLLAYIVRTLPHPPEAHFYAVVNNSIMLLGPMYGYCTDSCTHPPFIPIKLEVEYESSKEL